MIESDREQVPLKELTRKQRRVLGVLLEKAFTTPEQYPLTLKGTTTGCNQKSNRDPVTNYDEETVAQTLQELAEMGFVGILYTESGRTERYRHYLRHRTSLTEPQLAILTELMLRGKQQLGELRTRASRMVPIPTLEQLRAELQGLLDQGLVRTNGPLERRGVEVDHNLYPAGETQQPWSAFTDELPAEAEVASPPTSQHTAVESEPRDRRLTALETRVAELEMELGTLRNRLTDLSDQLAALQRQLGT